ncbi:MAG: LuxR family transcriptional regulator [Rhizobiales bacterium]|nr:LuxR family transcriptional regulator [Hyphomicrobiales bacterium]
MGLIKNTYDILNIEFPYSAVNFCEKIFKQKILNLLQKKYDVEHFAYMGLKFPNQKEIEKYSIVSYDSEWVKRYIDEGYIHLDPCIQAGLKTIYPFDWSNLKLDNTRQLQMFNEAREFGIDTRHALTVPIRGVDGEIGLFSVVLKMTQQQFKDNIGNIVKELQNFSMVFHQQFYNSINLKKITRTALSPRQKEVLKWASEGKSVFDIAVIMGISAHTVKHHLSCARDALKVLNTTQACVVAVREKLLEY